MVISVVAWTGVLPDNVSGVVLGDSCTSINKNIGVLVEDTNMKRERRRRC